MTQSLKTASRKKIVWNFDSQETLLKWHDVHTVCEQSACPNRLECSTSGTATFLIGGKYCTRNCGFCKVSHGKPVSLSEIAEREQKEIINAVAALNLKFCVITSVTRDDDPEGLSRHFSQICRELKKNQIGVELLIPDFQMKTDFLERIGEAGPDVIAHNMETVENLSRKVRPQASYKKSLEVLQFYHTRYPKILVKTGFMVGLGETVEEIENTIRDIAGIGADILTIGQYLQPGSEQLPVIRYYSDPEFRQMKEFAIEAGIKTVESGYYVRSSYKAGEVKSKWSV